MLAIDPELAALLGPVDPRFQVEEPKHVPTIAEARAYCEQSEVAPSKAYHKPFLPLENTYDVQDRKVSVDDGEITVRCIVPVAADELETFPVLVNMHGGGWSVGSIDLDDYFLRKVAVDLQLSIVNVDYRLAPEYPFPTAVTDCLAALKWVASNTALLKGDLSKGFLVCGHSAGANLAAVLAHEARDDPFFRGPGRQLTGQILREPLVIHPDAYPEKLKPEMRSMEENKYMPPLTRATADFVVALYNPVRNDSRFSPLLYTSHHDLPRAFVQGMALDILRDDARAYAKALREAGVECRHIEYPGVSHGFHHNYPAITAAIRVRADLVQGIKWVLSKDSET
ncbi:AB hydrolase superfamily protein B1A11.02 [Trametes pubescens]|uniref:AB hydrolase superfamily protein B1A11.02 n=1 Tax=Trametes pubescens TaxID=154538 RepID=A0A1M2VY14_TRAPU|nr:AB hydrolase superfamily protein B1A11.02 [Trametes pubescens]